jgi:phosphoribosylformimino-5-aminoimidazole carboxamide ribotide isomerase
MAMPTQVGNIFRLQGLASALRSILDSFLLIFTTKTRDPPSMEIWPAIDLLGGNCVRLRQGDYSRNTVFSQEPGQVAQEWFDAGASFLHCVDLDGAKSGSIVNQRAIEEILQAAHGRIVQLGGGVRTEATIRRLLDLGLSRLVVGTAALRDPKWFASMCKEFPNQLVLGLDAKEGLVATEGWLDVSKTPASVLIEQIAELTDQCAAIVYTDIDKDGMMEGPNFQSLAQIQKISAFPVIASGGVTTLEDVQKLATLKTHGAIIGRALYEGTLSLKEALRISQSDSP